MSNYLSCISTPIYYFSLNLCHLFDNSCRLRDSRFHFFFFIRSKLCGFCISTQIAMADIWSKWRNRHKYSRFFSTIKESHRQTDEVTICSKLLQQISNFFHSIKLLISRTKVIFLWFFLKRMVSLRLSWLNRWCSLLVCNCHQPLYRIYYVESLHLTQLTVKSQVSFLDQ